MDERMGRRDFLVVGSGVALAGLTGCGGNGSGGSGGTYRGDLAVSHLDAVISAAPFHIAADLGYYRQSGLDVRLVSFAGGADTVRAIAGKSRFGMPATLPALTAYAKGQSGLRIIGGAFNAAEVVFIVPAASPIRTPKDLGGKKVAVSQPGSITNYFANHIARANGVTAKIVNVGGAPEAWTSAKQGVTDAAWSTLPLSTDLVARGEARVVARTRDYVPVWADNTYWSTQRFIDDSPEVLRKWLAAQQKAMNLIHGDLDRAAAIYGKRMKLDTAVARKALEPAVPALTLKIDRAGVEENIKAGVELEQFDAGKIDLDKIIVPDLLPSGGS
jgi:NitT/TauT family transport system substrate-binding protein